MHRSTIGRELQRNHGQRVYRPKQAHQMALQRRNKAIASIQEDTWALIESKLRQDWSPEKVSGWLLKNTGIQVSQESIYQYTLTDRRADGNLYKQLCQITL